MAALNTLTGLLSEVEGAPHHSLVFAVDDRRLASGFHLTEIKAAAIRSVDCGRATDAWDEAILQILEGTGEPVSQPMTVAAFTRIIAAGRAHLDDAVDGRLIVEVGGRNTWLQRYTVSHVMRTDADEVVVSLTPEKAACKAAARALAAFAEGSREHRRASGQNAGGCCGVGPSTSGVQAAGKQRMACCT